MSQSESEQITVSKENLCAAIEKSYKDGLMHGLNAGRAALKIAEDQKDKLDIKSKLMDGDIATFIENLASEPEVSRIIKPFKNGNGFKR